MSETKQIAIKPTFSIKTIRRAIALIGDAATDEEINKRFVDIEPIEINFDEMVGEIEAVQLCLAFVALIMANKEGLDISIKDKPKTKSLWEERLEKMKLIRGDK